MLGLNRRAFIGMGAAVVLTVGVLGTSVFAETPTPTTSTTQPSGQSQDYRQVFLTKLAAALGVDQTKLADSLKKAETDTIDQAVQNGDLAKNRADAMKQRVQQGDTGFLGGFGGRGGRFVDGGPGPRGAGGGAMQAAEQAAADKLGLSLQDLQTQLRSGKSLVDIAKEKGVSEADLRAAMVAAAKTQLDKDVAAGNLTQQQEDNILQQLQQGPLPGAPGGRPGGPPAGPAA